MDFCIHCGEMTHWTLLSAMLKRGKTFTCPFCGKENEVFYDYWKR